MCDNCGCNQQDRDIELQLNEMRQTLNYVAGEFIWLDVDDAGEEAPTDPRYLDVEKIIRCLNKDTLGRLLAKHLLEMDETDPDLSINLSDVFLGQL